MEPGHNENWFQQKILQSRGYELKLPVLNGTFPERKKLRYLAFPLQPGFTVFFFVPLSNVVFFHSVAAIKRKYP
jgi:hypothetical protein